MRKALLAAFAATLVAATNSAFADPGYSRHENRASPSYDRQEMMRGTGSWNMQGGPMGGSDMMQMMRMMQMMNSQRDGMGMGGMPMGMGGMFAAGNGAFVQSLDADDDESHQQYDEDSGLGFGDTEENPEEAEKPIKIAIVGRPNVGKSTLVNALLGEQRMMTGPEAGITRDAVSIPWEYDGRKLTLVDTAGMRKRAKVVDTMERDMVGDALRAIRLAQVVVLVLDSNQALERQDLAIADHVIREGRALIIAMNKWDEVGDRQEILDGLDYKLDTSLPQVKRIPVVTMSALHKTRLDTLMRRVFDIYDLWNKRVPTARLNRWLQMMVSHHPPPLSQGRPNKIRYMTQVKARPPTFGIWVSRPKDLPETYEKYLVNGLREDFDMPGVPIRLSLRTSKNPYHNK